MLDVQHLMHNEFMRLLNAVRLSTTSEVLVCVYAYVLNIDNAYKHKKHKNIISFIKVSKKLNRPIKLWIWTIYGEYEQNKLLCR